MCIRDSATGQLHHSFSHHLNDARFCHAANDNEQTGEEADRGPFNFADGLLHICTTDNEHDACSSQRDNARLDMEESLSLIHI